MGVDIYSFIEVQDRHDSKSWHCLAQIFINRNTSLFILMANGISGQPEALFSNRGIPHDASHLVEGKFTKYIDNEYEICDHNISLADAKNAIKNGESFYWNVDKTIITNPDYFSASWLSVKELSQIKEKSGSIELSIVINTMRDINRNPIYKSSRLVFWFDR